MGLCAPVGVSAGDTNALWCAGLDHAQLLKMRMEGGLEGIEKGPLLGRGSYGRVFKGISHNFLLALHTVEGADRVRAAVGFNSALLDCRFSVGSMLRLAQCSSDSNPISSSRMRCGSAGERCNGTGTGVRKVPVDREMEGRFGCHQSGGA